MATYWENSCSFCLRYVSWYKYLIVSLVFSHLGFWSGNLFLIAPFPDLCLLVPFHNDYIRNMVSEPGSKNKRLYSYFKGMKCDSSGVATLKKDGTNYSEAIDKAEILNDQFASVFTKEDCSSMPSMGNSLESEAPPLVIQDNGVRKILEGFIKPVQSKWPR